MKRLFALLLSILCVVQLTACSKKTASADKKSDGGAKKPTNFEEFKETLDET